MSFIIFQRSIMHLTNGCAKRCNKACAVLCGERVNAKLNRIRWNGYIHKQWLLCTAMCSLVSCSAELFSLRNIENLCNWYHFPRLKYHGYSSPWIVEVSDAFSYIFSTMAWPGDTRSQSISNHGIDLVDQECANSTYLSIHLHIPIRLPPTPHPQFLHRKLHFANIFI